MSFNKDWFDGFQINWLQAPEGFLGIHAQKMDVGCRYFEIPVEWIELDNFFDLVYEQAQKEWKKKQPENNGACQVCTHRFLPFHFRYKGKMFCRWCGSHYYLKDGKQIITRSIND